MATKRCPTCRVENTDKVPSYIVRELIGSMQVKCANGDEETNKRTRGNDGEPVTSVPNTCSWSGQCIDLKAHDDECQFKMITCSLEGCGHQCHRKDMNNHLSGDGFLRHMELMRAANDKKMEDMKKSITTSYKKKIDGMQRRILEMKQLISASDKKINSLQEKLSALESTQSNDTEEEDNDVVTVSNCGIVEINGVYKRNGNYNGSPMYSKDGIWDGEAVKFSIYRCGRWISWNISSKWWNQSLSNLLCI